ncbi:MAG: enoyl-CoA hydratase/isomerase family protein [Polyangia bacterium]
MILIDEPAPNVVRLRINRAEKRNAIDRGVREAFIDALQSLAPSTRALVIGGVGGTLSAGGDISTMSGMTEGEGRERMQHVHALCRLIARCPVPVVTALEGFAAGAAVGLALLGDHVVVGESSRLLFPFLRLGLAPDWGLLHTLPRRVGLSVARRLLVSGTIVDGAEALRLGLADEDVGTGDIAAAAVARAGELAQLPGDAFARMKARLAYPSATLDEEWPREEADQVALFASADFAEGLAAFAEKRPARFVR